MGRGPVRTTIRRIATGIAAVALLSTGAVAGELSTLSDGGRELLVYVPSALPAAGSRALVVVLHGGLGNASRIASRQAERGLNFDAVAEKDGFVVAYLNGTPVTRNLGPRLLGWNAGGGCCGVPSETNVDDVRYITAAVDLLVQRYGIDPAKVYGIGHSNGAMMTQRLICETPVFAAGIAISGPLNLPTSRCASANGRRVFAIHGAEDRNVPLAGGVGSKGLSRLDFRSEEDSRKVMEASGARYTLQVVPDADHALANLDAAILKSEGVDLATKAATWFGLTGAER